MQNTRLFPRPDEPIGYRRDGRPIYPQAGGSEPLDVEPDDGDSDGGSDDEGGGDGDKYTPPSRAEWLKVQNSLIKANTSAKQRREALAEAQRRVAQLEAAQAQREAEEERRQLAAQATPPAPVVDSGRKGKKGGGGVVPAPVPQGLPDGVFTKAQLKQLTAEATRAAVEQERAKLQTKVVGQAARAALIEAGMSKASAARMVGTLNLDEVEIDDDGEVVGGLEEQVEALKEELPQLFAAPEPPKKTTKRTPVTRATAAGRNDAPIEYKTSADRMAAQILGGR